MGTPARPLASPPKGVCSKCWVRVKEPQQMELKWELPFAHLWQCPTCKNIEVLTP